MKSKLFKIAHSIKANYATFSEALKYAWKVIRLRIKMKSGVVSFSFIKVDGSIRKAIGTLKDIPASTGTKSPNHSVFTYFDIEAASYRSARIENLIF